MFFVYKNGMRHVIFLLSQIIVLLESDGRRSFVRSFVQFIYQT